MVQEVEGTVQEVEGTVKIGTMRWFIISLFVLLGLVRQGGQFESEAQVTFGQQVVFTLTAVTDQPPTAVTLTIQPANQDAQTEPLRPQPLADGRWQAQFTLEPQAWGLSPFTTIAYEWAVASDGRETITVPRQTVTYQDDRFAWKKIEQSVAGTAVSVFWPGASDKPGRDAFTITQQAVATLQNVLPLPPQTVALPIFLYPSSADLRAALRLNGHDWTAGHSDPALGVVLVTAVNDKTTAADLHGPLPHEIAHIWLYRAAGSHYGTMPYWFKEGLAMWLAGDQPALMTTNPLPLAELCQAEIPANTETATAQSGALVQFVDERYGREALAALAAAFAQGADCDTAVSLSLGMSAEELETQWLSNTSSRPTAVRFVQQNGLWLMLLLGSFVLMALLLVRPARR